MQHLQGKVALVTGASRGLGAAIAVALAEAGAKLALLSRSPCEATCDAVHAAGTQALARSCNVGSYGEVAEAAAGLLEHFGRLDIVVNNAGVIEPIGHLGDTDPEAWRHSLTTNLIGPYNVVRATIAALEASGGVILNISSGAAQVPREGWSAYCAAKAGLAMLTRSIHHDYGARGVRVYGVQPGVVDTDIQAKVRASGMNEMSRIAQADLAQPMAPACLIARLCEMRPEDLRGKDFAINAPEVRSRLEPAAN